MEVRIKYLNFANEYFTMAEKEKISLPGSGGGLFRPHDAEGQGLKIKPEQVIIFCAAVVVTEILIKLFI